MSCYSKPQKQQQKLRKNQDSVLFFFHFSSFNEIQFFFSLESLSTALFCLHLKYSLKENSHSRRRMKNLPNPWKNFVTRRAQIFQIEIFIFHKKSFFSEIFARLPDFSSFSTNFHKDFPKNHRKSLIFFHNFPILRFFLTLQLIFSCLMFCYTRSERSEFRDRLWMTEVEICLRTWEMKFFLCESGARDGTFAGYLCFSLARL